VLAIDFVVGQDTVEESTGSGGDLRLFGRQSAVDYRQQRPGDAGPSTDRPGSVGLQVVDEGTSPACGKRAVALRRPFSLGTIQDIPHRLPADDRIARH
jgi:hypothetical protein